MELFKRVILKDQNWFVKIYFKISLIILQNFKDVRGKAWTTVYDVMDYIGNKFDIFESYKVDKYMYAYGLSVHKNYRGRGIATKILEARINLGRAIGVEITSTLFTTIASQVPADKVGFEVNVEQR